MFGKRADGRLVRTLDPFQRIMPYLMRTRTDSMNMFEESIACRGMDDYILAKAAQGVQIEYIHIILATMVRLLALRPQLNRFVMRGRIFARRKIWISFVVHRSLKNEDAGTTIKLCFDGTEDIFRVAEQINKAVAKELTGKQGDNSTDQTAAILMKIPGPLIQAAVNFLLFLDRHDMLPQAVMEASPFHTSLFFTNLKSLGINHIYHHVYEFGTTGLFLAIGKERDLPAAAEEGLVVRKMLSFGLVMDERFCDGLYFARSLRLMKKFLRRPELLEMPLAAKIEDMP